MTEASDPQTAKDGVIHEDNPPPRRLHRWLRPLLALWYVHSDVTLLVYAPPSTCLGTLMTAAKPSQNRLHLRNLFAYGRRYHFIEGSPDGFKMVTTSKIPWRYKGRTQSNATLTAEFQVLDETLTQINISSQIRIWNIWGRLMMPIFFTPLFLYAVWQPPVIRLLEILLIYMFAWVSYRYSAAIDAHDMVYFIEKALEDFMPTSVSELSAHVPHVMNNRDDFPDAWEKFYKAHSNKTEE
jgi:hypothetical protein